MISDFTMSVRNAVNFATKKTLTIYVFLLLIACGLFMLNLQFNLLRADTVVSYVTKDMPEGKIFSETSEMLHKSQQLNNRIVDQERVQHRNLQRKSMDASQKINILIWYYPYGRQVERVILAEECGPCVITYKLAKINLPETKAVVFHFKELVLKTMPKKRRVDQLYVWWAQETPKAMKEIGITLTEFDDIFNLTMTYRRDSDIYSPYGTAQESYALSNQHYHFQSLRDVINMKTKIAVWIVSNCGKYGDVLERMTLTNNLVKNGVKVDRFGTCFGRHVAKNDTQRLIEHYKFYFAFENTQYCKDYITEKFFRNSLKFSAVPVVFGAKKSDYEVVAPPNSYIYANDFSAKGLADYLIYLDQNDNAYARYHEWRFMAKKEMPFFGAKMKWCQLCRTLHGYEENQHLLGVDQSYEKFPNSPRTVHSLANWFYGRENIECMNHSRTL